MERQRNDKGKLKQRQGKAKVTQHNASKGKAMGRQMQRKSRQGKARQDKESRGKESQGKTKQRQGNCKVRQSKGKIRQLQGKTSHGNTTRKNLFCNEIFSDEPYFGGQKETSATKHFQLVAKGFVIFRHPS